MKKIFAVILAATFICSCEDFTDVNQNPNQTTVSTPELVLTGALATTAQFNFYNAQVGAMFSGQWAPSGDVSGFIPERTYDFNNTYGAGVWTGFYDNLRDYKYVMDESEKQGKHTAHAMAKVMSTFLFHKLVDTYNNVPYTDALQGTTVIRPSYDPGQAVYEAIIDDLDEAVAELASADPTDNPGAADIMFKGDINQWIRFANTLKLRLLIRQSEMPGRASYINAELAEISGGFLETNANIDPGYLKTAGKLNPFWAVYYKNESDALQASFNFWRSTTYLISQISTEPRLNYIVAPSGSNAQSTAAGTRVGVQYGDQSPAAYSNVTSGIGFGILKSFNMPSTIVTASESYFLQSEAVLRGYMTGNAQALYNEGIAQSYLLLGLSRTQAQDYINTNPAAQWNGTLQRLITQKWIASVGYGGFEAWSDYRRTGFPNIPLSISAIRSAIPVRLYYPNQEIQTNAANVAAQGDIDAITSKVFWDVN